MTALLLPYPQNADKKIWTGSFDQFGSHQFLFISIWSIRSFSRVQDRPRFLRQYQDELPV